MNINNFVPENSTIYQKYTIKRIIGQGGMGCVFLVVDNEDPSKQYALKYLHPMADAITVKRFKEEVNLLRKIQSNYIPKLYSYCFLDKESYYVMDYIQGNTLFNVIRAEGAMNAKRARNFLKKTAEAIGELHANGVIHRDIKSQNIILTNTNEVKVIDLGISLTKDSQRLTKVNAVICSPFYAAPEYSIKNAEITKAVDIYALGVLMFEMLTGQYPFEGARDQDTISMHYKNTFPSPKDFVTVPQALANVVIKATAKRPEDRYESVYDLINDLETSLDASRVFEKPLVPKTLKPKKTLSQRINSNTFLISCIVIILLIIIGFGIALYFLGLF
ncbi:serine/threonine-protein kinase [Mycoplasma nasistruthionis]|uniref:Serine/threonine protein kinase n=1 Tax=Mycoplasma nasistruthionis TaxID=353852 RepID=A0A4Y6I5Z7_9MOLU|nr:serine/threonine-protein kinase [Mycoplasma nasistruthionis]QDF65046.1 serine/threonine protein kinase [Mycoplasma nasistruthionis]